MSSQWWQKSSKSLHTNQWKAVIILSSLITYDIFFECFIASVSSGSFRTLFSRLLSCQLVTYYEIGLTFFRNVSQLWSPPHSYDNVLECFWLAQWQKKNFQEIIRSKHHKLMCRVSATQVTRPAGGETLGVVRYYMSGIHHTSSTHTVISKNKSTLWYRICLIRCRSYYLFHRTILCGFYSRVAFI